MTLDDLQVRDLLFGDTDPREVALLLCQQGLTGDATERDQRLRIIDALNAHHTRRLADETVALARSSRSLATWTRWLAVATFVVALGTLILAIATLIDDGDDPEVRRTPPAASSAR